MPWILGAAGGRPASRSSPDPRAPTRASPAGGGSVSPASSGWNAVASTFRSRTATILPSSRRASTSTSGPVRSTIGARMKTPWTGRSPSTGPTGRSRKSPAGGRTRCAQRSRRAAAGSVPPRRRSSRAMTIIPAHVPNNGALLRANRAGPCRPQRSMPRRIVVLSPPGMIRPLIPSSSAGSRTWNSPRRCGA